VTDRRGIGFIGVGRVGSALGAALLASGYRVVAAASRSSAARSRSSRWLPSVPLVSPAEVARRSEIVFVTVSDDAISPVVESLVAEQAIRSGQWIVHTSGRCGLDSLSAAGDVGAVPVALHPVMTFAGTEQDHTLVNGLPFGVTSPPSAREAVEAFVSGFGGVPVWVPDETRPLYHAAMVFAANNIITLTATALELLRWAEVSAPAELLGPIFRKSLDNALLLGDEALTGPVRRGDVGTIRSHLEALASASPEVVDAYVSLARLTASRAIGAGTSSPRQAGAVLEYLEQVERDRPR
jgi:predicted short-subunit dehydrogenase-like oxidoreductase (DUF2520 family)